MSAFIQLGPYYGRNITELRRAIAERRAAGAITVYLTAPVTSPVLEIAIDGRSLYVLGFRELGARAWWEFEPDTDTGLLLPAVRPGLLLPAVRIAGGPASYGNLGLTADTEVVMQPWQLVRELAAFDGRLGDAAKKRKLLLLISLVSEALRFDSVKAACYAYVSNAPAYFGAPEHFHRHPEHMAGHRFVFTERLVETVRNWRKRTEAGSPDIGLPWIG